MGASQVLDNLSSLSFLILTGGKSSRFGSDKKDALLNEISLFDRILFDIPIECQVIVSGPAPMDQIERVRVIEDDVLNMGPVAGIANSIHAISTEYVAIVATDTPFGIKIIDWLLQFVDGTAGVYIPVDQDGFTQSLCAIYESNSLKSFLSTLESVENQSMKSLILGLHSKMINVPIEMARFLTDIDTPEALYLAQEMFKKSPEQETLEA